MSDYRKFDAALQSAGVCYKTDEPMSAHTSFKIGGPADRFVEVKTVSELQAVLNAVSDENVPYFILGNGSNLLVPDEGLRGAVLTLLARLLAAPLAKLFVGYDEGLYTLTCHAFRLFSFAFLFAGFNIFASSFFTALGNGLISAAISFLRTLVFQTASVLILPLIFDVDGIWYAITVAEVFATLISVIFLFAKRKKYHYMECSPHGKK